MECYANLYYISSTIQKNLYTALFRKPENNKFILLFLNPDTLFRFYRLYKNFENRLLTFGKTVNQLTQFTDFLHIFNNLVTIRT